MKISMFKVAKDYSQPEVRRQQDEDKRLRLQVGSVLGEDWTSFGMISKTKVSSLWGWVQIGCQYFKRFRIFWIWLEGNHFSPIQFAALVIWPKKLPKWNNFSAFFYLIGLTRCSLWYERVLLRMSFMGGNLKVVQETDAGSLLWRVKLIRGGE